VFPRFFGQLCQSSRAPACELHKLHEIANDREITIYLFSLPLHSKDIHPSERNIPQYNKMASTFPPSRSQSSINLIAPSAVRHQDIFRALEASASMLPKYYVNAKKSASASESKASSAELEGSAYSDYHHLHQPPPPPPSPVGFPSSPSLRGR
jgi:hypothetical protein